MSLQRPRALDMCPSVQLIGSSASRGHTPSPRHSRRLAGGACHSWSVGGLCSELSFCSMAAAASCHESRVLAFAASAPQSWPRQLRASCTAADRGAFGSVAESAGAPLYQAARVDPAPQVNIPHATKHESEKAPEMLRVRPASPLHVRKSCSICLRFEREVCV